MRSMLMGRSSSFAHFAGLGRGGRRAEEETPKDDDTKGKKSRAADGDDEDEDDKPKGKAADDDAPAQYPDDDDTKGRKSRAADGDDDDDDEDEPKGKKSRAEDDDDEEEMTGKSAVAGARRRERARCAAIFNHPAAAENPQLACSLAFETTLTRQGALAVLKSQAGRTANRADLGAGRRDRNPSLGAGGDTITGKGTVKGLWDAAVAKANPKPRFSGS